ncbi:helix-turn-helix domain-containing protein [Paenibacillus spongiae]|uniref:XRE family transcriptional regulator n=1 Tax=Paenibacillus spongiae TaxID=2909671 RepID=A0ABY5SGY6_9BACL|nr:XRE family transcriptional regulator [Paenibacillus spongiae]UVI32924.1 XRE family transcriptional regulator [Paenibacillus spongiae]
MDYIHIRIGHNLQKIRKQQGLSLEKTAQLTNVSKGMLHQIERGVIQPTVTTVWKIATGLHISFSDLLKDDETSVSIVTRKDEPDVTEDNGRCKLFMLFPFDPQTRFEMYTIILETAGSCNSTPHNEGVQEYITVVSGMLQIRIQDETYTLREGQSIRFAGNVPHRYMNHAEDTTTLHVTMHYAESWG